VENEIREINLSEVENISFKLNPGETLVLNELVTGVKFDIINKVDLQITLSNGKFFILEGFVSDVSYNIPQSNEELESGEIIDQLNDLAQIELLLNNNGEVFTLSQY